jgi:hypothetical protein
MTPQMQATTHSAKAMKKDPRRTLDERSRSAPGEEG